MVVAGKTAYRGMAIEGARIRVLRLNGAEWEESASGRSGYHGAFAVKAEPGLIRLEARGEIFMGGREIPLAGRVAVLEVPPGARRVDRVVVELAPVVDEPGGTSRAVDGAIRPGVAGELAPRRPRAPLPR